MSKVSCRQCGLVFKIKPSEVKPNGNFCTATCFKASRPSKVSITCATCGKAFKRIPSHVTGGDQYCSKRCYGLNTRGSNSHFWKGGITPDRNSREYVQWRLEVMERDQFTCSSCGKLGGSLEVHHILAYARYPHAREILDNGTTLCKSCHKDFHDSYGKHEFTDKDYFKWLDQK